MYDKLATYFEYIFKQKNIPHIVVETGLDAQNYMNSYPDERLIVVYMFSYIVNYGWPVPNAQYLIVVSDPEHNLDVGFSDRNAVEKYVFGFVCLTTIIDGYLQRYWPTKPIFHVFQGYVPYEDFPYSVDVSKKSVDVLAAGWEMYDKWDRGKLVQTLRDRGLIVDDKRRYGKDLDIAIEKAKISICFPFDCRYGTWHGQRTLWAINKQICVVTTASKDETCEQFYSKGIYTVAPWDIQKFADVVVDLIQSGKWKQAGMDGYANYRQYYDAFDLIQGPFYDFCRKITNTAPPPKISKQITCVDMSNELDASAYFQTTVPWAKWITSVNPNLNLISIFKVIQNADAEINWPGFDVKRDVVVCSNLDVPECEMKTFLLDFEPQSLMFSGVQLDEYLTKTPTKIIYLRHPYGMPMYMPSVLELVNKHERQHGFRPIVIEDRSTANGSTLINISSFIQIYHVTKDFGWIIWPTQTFYLRAKSMLPSLELEHANQALIQMIQWPLQQQKTIKNYLTLNQNIGRILKETHTRELSMVRESGTHLTVCSCLFPILENDDTCDNLQNYLQTMNIECQLFSSGKRKGVLIPCGHWISENELTYIIQTFEYWVKYE